MKKFISTAAVALSLLVLTGCAGYVAPEESITPVIKAENVSIIEIPEANKTIEIVIFDIERDGEKRTCTTKRNVSQSGISCFPSK